MALRSIYRLYPVNYTADKWQIPKCFNKYMYTESRRKSMKNHRPTVTDIFESPLVWGILEYLPSGKICH